jgi:hypothetical protein
MLTEACTTSDDGGMPNEPRSRYAGSLADLEASAHVPLEQQVTELAEAPAEAPISAEDLDRQRLLGITGAGRLNVR